MPAGSPVVIAMRIRAGMLAGVLVALLAGMLVGVLAAVLVGVRAEVHAALHAVRLIFAALGKSKSLGALVLQGSGATP